MPEYVELHKANYPPKSLGYQSFPPILEGRIRPVQIFEQPVRNLIPFIYPQTADLREVGIRDLSEMMDFPAVEFARIRNWAVIKRELINYLRDDLAKGPQGHLLDAIFLTTSLPVPVEFEGRSNRAVTSRVNKLSPLQKSLVDKSFGLNSGIRLTNEQVVQESGIKGWMFSVFMSRAFSKLRHPSSSAILSLYTSLTDNSLGKKAFGSNFGCEINEMISADLSKQTIGNFDFNYYVLEEFPSLISEWRHHDYLPLSILIRFEERQFSEPVYRELQQVLLSLKI